VEISQHQVVDILKLTETKNRSLGVGEMVLGQFLKQIAETLDNPL
jgi:hypothetical protein